MEYQTSMPGPSHSFVLVWLASQNADTQSSLDCFKKIDVVKTVEIFYAPFACISHLSSLQNEKVLLILSNTSAKSVTSLVHDMINVSYIYVFSNNAEIYSQSTDNYAKVRGVYSDADTLISKILSDTNTLTDIAGKMALFTEETLSISVYNSAKSGTLTEKFHEITNSFILLQIFADVLLSSIESTGICDRTRAIEACRENYRNNNVELAKIHEFASNYQRIHAIRWYTRDCFLPRQLNNAFHRFDLDSLLAFRFFIVDLHNQLNEIHMSQIPIFQQQFKTFAGKLLSGKEMEIIRNNIGGLLSMGTFFETTLDSAIALIFSGEGQARPQMESVVFEIDIYPDGNYVKPFADVSTVSCFPQERTVLFSFGFVFRIESADFDEKTLIWHVKLTCNNEVQIAVKEIIDRFKIDLGTPIDNITFANVLNKLNRTKEAEKYCEMLLNMTFTSQEDRAQIFGYLSNAFFLQGNYHSALEYSYKAIDNLLCAQKPIEPKNDSQDDQREFQQSTLNPNWLLRSQIYNNIGSIHQRLGDYENALEFFQKSIDEALDYKYQSSELAESYNNAADVLFYKRDYGSALKYYYEALDIALQTLPLGHRSIKQYLDNITSLEGRTSCADDVTSAAKHFQNLTTTTYQSDATSTKKDFPTSSMPGDQFSDTSS